MRSYVLLTRFFNLAQCILIISYYIVVSVANTSLDILGSSRPVTSPFILHI